MIHFISNYNKLDQFVEKGIKPATMADLYNWLAEKKQVAVDTETTGDFDFKNRVIMLQIGDGSDQFVIDTRDTDVSGLGKYMEDPSILKLLHNAKFDIKFLRFSFGFEVVNVYDTFLVECLLTNGIKGRSLGLAAVCEKYLGVYMDKSVRLNFLKKGSLEYNVQEVLYSAVDVEHLIAVKNEQKVGVDQYSLQPVVDLENEVTVVLADIEYNGMKLDKDKWIAQAEKVEEELETRRKELTEYIVNNCKSVSFIKKDVQLTMFGEDPELVDINWDSPIQAKRLFTELRIPVKSTDAKELALYKDKYPIIDKYITYKKTAKLVTTYGKNFLTYINEVTGRVHTNFWQILDTARVSSGGSDICPNMQNLPASNDYRNPFVARKGFKIVSCDFSGQEARLAASGSQEPTWVDSFREGKDLHSEVAANIFGIKAEQAKDKPEFLKGKSYRDVAKTINFAILYGAGEHKISKSLGLTKEEARQIIDTYFSKTPKLIKYLQGCADYGIRNGYIRSFKPYSFVRFLDGWYPGITRERDEKLYERLRRVCFNSPIQSTGAYMTKKALIEIWKYIKNNDLRDKVYIVMTVHDQIDTEVFEDFAEEWSKIQKSIMESVGDSIVKNVKILSDVTISDCWKK